MTIKFHNFHAHDGHSYLDGIGDAKEYIDRAMELGYYGCGISNHGNCASILEWYEYGKKVNFPVTLGQEFYAECDEVVFAPKDERKNLNSYYHLIVIAKNKKGYENLMKLSSLAYHEDRFYKRPRISFSDLFNNKEGLIVTSACVVGPVAKPLAFGDENGEELALKHAKLFKEEFGDDWFLEIETIDISYEWDKETNTFVRKVNKETGEIINEQETANRGIIKIAEELNIPIVIGLDSHMPYKEQKVVQDISIQTRSGGWHFWDTYHLKTLDEMWEECQRVHPYITREQFEEWCNNTSIIADKCNVELDFHPQLPAVENNTIKDLYRLIIQKNKIPWDKEEYINRLKNEIDVIHRNGRLDLLDYFFVLEDLVSWCEKTGIIVGPGRGSACGSLLAYALGITNIDPIPYNLMFERFLSLPRILSGSLPDIDLDFSDPQAVKDYLRERYGESKVFSIGTVQQIKIKNAFTDISRIILGDEFDYWQNKELAKGLPGTGPGAKLELILKGIYDGRDPKTRKIEGEERARIEAAISKGCLSNTYTDEASDKWRKWIDTHPKGKTIYDIMLKILGLPRQIGVHACAVAISRENMDLRIPTALNKKVPVTQFTASWCEKAGIIKFDILGLNTLKDFQECVKMIYDRHGVKIDIYNLDTKDPMVYQAFQKGDTDTVFQFHTPLQKRLLKDIGVNSIEDLAVITAIARPGPLSSGVDKIYSEGKKDVNSIKDKHPIMKKVTGDTYGALIYQEQIMKFFNIVGGLSLTESEQVRRAISKYKADLMKQYQGQFKEYTTHELGMTEDLSLELWHDIEKYCAYSFNKSHAVAYAYVGYACQYLKTHFPIEWWCAVLKNCDDADFKKFYGKLPSYIKLNMPDINDSKENFFIPRDGEISIPISKIKGVGPKAAESVVAGQPYTSLFDFCTRVNKRSCKKNVMVNLILAGCFDKFEPELDRITLLTNYFLFREEEIPAEYTKLDRIQIMDLEAGVLEFKSLDFLSMFPDLFHKNCVQINIAKERMKGHGTYTGGKVTKKLVKKTKRGSKFCQIYLYNNNDEIKITYWDKKYEEMYNPVKVGDIIQVYGEVDVYGGTISLTGRDLKTINYTD